MRSYSPIGASLLSSAIFCADLLGPFQGSAAVLYVFVILWVAKGSNRNAVVWICLGCTLLTVAAFVITSRDGASNVAIARFVLSLGAIAAAAVVSLRDDTIRTTLTEQARILELTQDTVIIRDIDDSIVFWNDGAERLYGWTRKEAVGKPCQQLLHCEFPSADVERTLLETGEWLGELSRTCRDGRRIVLSSRWLQRKSPEGRSVGIIETSTDLTEQRRADAERLVLERRYSAIFHAAGFATWESDWSALWRLASSAALEGKALRVWLVAHPEEVREAASQATIRDVNKAAVELFGAESREALIGGNIVGRYLPESESAFARMVASLFAGSEVVDIEARYRTLSGGIVDVLLWITPLHEGEPWSRLLVMVHDITERNEARAKLEKASADLAHAARVSILGELSASIAHEVSQPLAAITNYGKSGKRWLSSEAPNIDEVDDCLDHIILNGNRAAEVIDRVRLLARKEAPKFTSLNIADVIEESVSLVQRQASAAQVGIRVVIAEDLPSMTGDRVQIEQVIVNLVINAIHALRDVAGRAREIQIGAGTNPDGMMRVSIRDNGTGITGDPQNIFTPFFTTKGGGMGMGLSICRSIVESSGGRIVASNNPDFGATVSFTLPRRALSVS